MDRIVTNLDSKVVEGFGDEWSRFDQSTIGEDEMLRYFSDYFKIFPWDSLPVNAVGFDLGCGSGRWAKLVSPRVGKLHCIDASSDALAVASRNLSEMTNCETIHASVEQIPLQNESMDFGYSLGVLHHVPDTAAGVKACVEKLKPGAPFLIYLYYAFDNRPAWFRGIWKVSELGRRLISRMPHNFRYVLSQVLAVGVYWPLARLAGLMERLGADVSNFPLSAYRKYSFYIMRNDALDRFGTRLEQRFTRAEIESMMLDSGLRDIHFHEDIPFWCAVGIKA